MSFSIIFYGGGLLIIMGHNTRSESLFYYFQIEDHVVQYRRECSSVLPKSYIKCSSRIIEGGFVIMARRAGSKPAIKTIVANISGAASQTNKLGE